MGKRTDNERRAARRNMVGGLLAGAILATVAGAYAKTTFKQMVKNTPATAADVNTAHQDLADAVDKLKAKLAKLKGAHDCPPGYSRDATATTITLCKQTSGSDEMVKVNNYWIDRYEVILVDSKTYNGGKCNGTGGKCGSSSTEQCGAGLTDDYPATFPDSGNWTTRVYACSKKGIKPSGNMTYFQIQQACLLAGKRLCTNAEWQGAVAGTQDPGKHNGIAGGGCHTYGTGSRKTGMAGQVPGGVGSCISNYGAEDMIGNLWETVDLWDQTGRPWMTTNGQIASPWPKGKGYGDGADKTWNINSRTNNNSGFLNGAPALAYRGGTWDSEITAGAFNLHFANGPAVAILQLGARCCRK